MKRTITIGLAIWMLIGAAMTGALGEEAIPSNGGRSSEQLYEELIVGTTTSFSGNFMGEMWGSNASDIDVRTLLHAYSLTDWQAGDGSFIVNQTVVSGLVSELNDAGDKLYFVTLVDGLKYSDGSPITAKDYVFSLLLAASKEIGELGAMTARLSYVAGAQGYSAGESEVFSGVRLYGEKNFSVTIKQEYLPFFYEMGLLDIIPFPISVIAPGCEVADDGEGAYIRNIDEEVLEPLFTAELLEKTLLDSKTGYRSYPEVTSGAYKLISYDEKAQAVKFEINEHFIGDQDGRKPVIERITFKVVTVEDALAELLDGSVDLLNRCLQASLIQSSIEMRANVSGFLLQQYMRSGLGFVSFNCEQGPAQFQPVRQALTLCLDREAFIGEQVDNFGSKVNGYYGMGQWMAQLVNGGLPAPLPELSENPTAAEQEAYDEAAAAWEALTLDNLKDYTVDAEAAKALLVGDGWIYNEEGEAFNPEVDTVRAKLVESAEDPEVTELMMLDMVLIVPEEGGVQDKFLDMQENMRSIGAKLTIETMPYEEMLKRYYRQEPRENDMFFLGTNFTRVFEPSSVYSIYDEDQGVRNTTGLRDEKLMELATDMNRTEAGEVLSYVQKWLVFQEYWNEVLPMIPIYSNVYFDVYTNRLQDYYVSQNTTWSEAILFAYLGDAVEEEETEEDELEGTEGIFVPFGATPLEEGGIILP